MLVFYLFWNFHLDMPIIHILDAQPLFFFNLAELGLGCSLDFSLVVAGGGSSLAVERGVSGFSSCGSWAQ